eukprot:31373-Pelagococcus_subviridis.AAC.3
MTQRGDAQTQLRDVPRALRLRAQRVGERQRERVRRRRKRGRDVVQRAGGEQHVDDAQERDHDAVDALPSTQQRHELGRHDALQRDVGFQRTRQRAAGGFTKAIADAAGGDDDALHERRAVRREPRGVPVPAPPVPPVPHARVVVRGDQPDERGKRDGRNRPRRRAGFRLGRRAEHRGDARDVRQRSQTDRVAPAQRRARARGRGRADAVDLLARLFQERGDDRGGDGRVDAAAALRGGEHPRQRLHRSLAHPRPDVAAVVHAVILEARQERLDRLSRGDRSRGLSVRVAARRERADDPGQAANRARPRLGVARLGVLLGDRRRRERVDREPPRRRRLRRRRRRGRFFSVLSPGPGLGRERFRRVRRGDERPAGLGHLREQQLRGHHPQRERGAASRGRVRVARGRAPTLAERVQRRRQLHDESLRAGDAAAAAHVRVGERADRVHRGVSNVRARVLQAVLHGGQQRAPQTLRPGRRAGALVERLTHAREARDVPTRRRAHDLSALAAVQPRFLDRRDERHHLLRERAGNARLARVLEREQRLRGADRRAVPRLQRGRDGALE